MQHSVSDVLSLVMKLNEQSSLKISADKDNRLLLFNECIKNNLGMTLEICAMPRLFIIKSTTS